MVIKREIGGETVEIELTERELYEAYIEKQAKYDIEDVECAFTCFEDDELEDMYGMTRVEIEEKIPEIAREMRRNIDKYDMNWQDARDAAIAEIL